MLLGDGAGGGATRGGQDEEAAAVENVAEAEVIALIGGRAGARRAGVHGGREYPYVRAGGRPQAD